MYTHSNTSRQQTEKIWQKIGYKNQQEFVARAEKLCDRFLGNGRVHSRQCLGKDQGFILAFSSKADKLDILSAKGSKLVYKAMDIVFVLNENKVVLKSPSEVVCSNNGRLVIIKKGKSFFMKK